MRPRFEDRYLKSGSHMELEFTRQKQRKGRTKIMILKISIPFSEEKQKSFYEGDWKFKHEFKTNSPEKLKSDEIISSDAQYDQIMGDQFISTIHHKLIPHLNNRFKTDLLVDNK